LTDPNFCPNPDSANLWCKKRRQQGKTIGLVPTMGALHDGHLTLVDKAVSDNELCVVSIFVNPLQFSQPEDFNIYPRDIQQDIRLLATRGCHMVLTGTLAEFFPAVANLENIKMLEPGPYAAGLEGLYRPGHFAGVKTIVDRLFATVHPDKAYFGEKDFQQTLVIQDLAEQSGFPDIQVCATQREVNGLAMSSRNQRLSASQRQQAGRIYWALLAARQAWREGVREATMLAKIMHLELSKEAFNIEYAEVRDPQNWTAEKPDHVMRKAQALIAINLDGVRLIDNMSLHEE
jgi:pantoate--beta-alanine ligase